MVVTVRFAPPKVSLRLLGRGKDWTLQVTVTLSSMTITSGSVVMVKLGASVEGGEGSDRLKNKTAKYCEWM